MLDFQNLISYLNTTIIENLLFLYENIINILILIKKRRLRIGVLKSIAKY